MGKIHFNNFDSVVVQMWRYMKITEFKEMDRLEAERLEKAA